MGSAPARELLDPAAPHNVGPPNFKKKPVRFPENGAGRHESPSLFMDAELKCLLSSIVKTQVQGKRGIGGGGWASISCNGGDQNRESTRVLETGAAGSRSVARFRRDTRGGGQARRSGAAVTGCGQGRRVLGTVW
jgi:hypothetical protein